MKPRDVYEEQPGLGSWNLIPTETHMTGEGGLLEGISSLSFQSDIVCSDARYSKATVGKQA